MSIPMLIFAAVAVALVVLFVIGLSRGVRGRSSKRDSGDGYVHGGDSGRRADKDSDSDSNDGGGDGGAGDGGGGGGD